MHYHSWKKKKIQLYNSFTPATLENPNSLQNPLTKQNKSHMMPISMVINTLPAAGAALHWKHRSIRRMKRPSESMLALWAQTEEWMNVALERWGASGREMEGKKWERGQKEAGERKRLDPALFNSQSVDITCWPHSGCTGRAGKCWQLTERGKVWKEERVQGVRGRPVRGN